jgi:putative endonuclease
MYYVYILKSKRNNQLYIGSTNDLKKRLLEHNKGKQISSKRYLPWELLYYESYNMESLARTREKRLKYNGNALREVKKRIGLLSSKSGAGFIALITVFIIISIALLISLGFALLSMSEMDMGFKKTQSSQAYFLANLCAEQALMKLKEDINYQGPETINIDNGSCQILQIEPQWIIKTQGNFQNDVRKMRISVSQVNPKIIINSWQEVADF